MEGQRLELSPGSEPGTWRALLELVAIAVTVCFHSTRISGTTAGCQTRVEIRCRNSRPHGAHILMGTDNKPDE